MLHWITVQVASIGDICTNPQTRNTLNTVANVGTFGALLAILKNIKSGTVTVGGTTFSMDRRNSRRRRRDSEDS